jgi:hypothetical protein
MARGCRPYLIRLGMVPFLPDSEGTMYRRIRARRGLRLLACMLVPIVLHAVKTGAQAPAATCGSGCVAYLPVIVYTPPPPPLGITDLRVFFDRSGHAATKGIIMNGRDVPLYDVAVQIEYFVNETVIQTNTLGLALPALLPGEPNSFASNTPGPSFSDYPRIQVRAQVLSWSTDSAVTYATLTTVSAEIKRSRQGSDDCLSVQGTLRNDHPFALKDVRLSAIGWIPDPSSAFGRDWFDAIPGSMQRNGGATTIQSGETLSYQATNGCEGTWQAGATAQILSQGVPVP